MKSIIALMVLIFPFLVSSQTSAKEHINNLASGAAVVRLYMNKPKMDLLKKTIDAETEESNKKTFERMLKEHEDDREAYVQKLISAFTEEYKFSKLYFIYDYNIKKLNEGVTSGIFLNNDGEIDNTIELKEKHYYLIGRDGSDDRFIMLQKNGEKLPSAFPATYNYNVLSFIVNIFKSNKLAVSVKKFNENLEKFYQKEKN